MYLCAPSCLLLSINRVECRRKRRPRTGCKANGPSRNGHDSQTPCSRRNSGDAYHNMQHASHMRVLHQAAHGSTTCANGGVCRAGSGNATPPAHAGRVVCCVHIGTYWGVQGTLIPRDVLWCSLLRGLRQRRPLRTTVLQLRHALQPHLQLK